MLHKSFVCKNCLTNLVSECAPKPPWPTGFEKSKIHHPKPEKLQFKGRKIQANFLDFKGKCWKISKNAQILLPINCIFSGLGWCILDFSKPVGQEGFGANFEAKLVSQFMQTKFLCHKKSQNTPIFSVSYYSDCTYALCVPKPFERHLKHS